MEINHQWMRGNLPSSAKCVVCKKACGSTKRLEGYRCLWCQSPAHAACRLLMPEVCSLGRHKLSLCSPASVRPPELQASATAKVSTTAEKLRLLTAELSEELSPQWQLRTPNNVSPLIVFVNPKSGGNQGVRVMRMFKGLLNPVQIYDLSRGGPAAGLEIIKGREGPSRALGCGGDGTIGWILQEADKLGINQMQLGVLPLGTGNDLARVLGWGASFSGSDMEALSDVLASVETGTSKLFDRWSICTSESTDLSFDEHSTINTEKSSKGVIVLRSVRRRNPAFASTDTDDELGEVTDDEALPPIGEEAGDSTSPGEPSTPEKSPSPKNVQLPTPPDTPLPTPATPRLPNPAMEDQCQQDFATLKRLGKMLELFIHSVNRLLAGHKDTGTEDLSVDDLSGMVHYNIAPHCQNGAIYRDLRCVLHADVFCTQYLQVLGAKHASNPE